METAYEALFSAISNTESVAEQLRIARYYLELARESRDERDLFEMEEALSKALQALDRVKELIEEAMKRI
jgi:lipopolysaccharide biosynthesis regulator YciM